VNSIGLRDRRVSTWTCARTNSGGKEKSGDDSVKAKSEKSKSVRKGKRKSNYRKTERRETHPEDWGGVHGRQSHKSACYRENKAKKSRKREQDAAKRSLSRTSGAKGEGGADDERGNHELSISSKTKHTQSIVKERINKKGGFRAGVQRDTRNTKKVPTYKRRIRPEKTLMHSGEKEEEEKRERGRERKRTDAYTY